MTYDEAMEQAKAQHSDPYVIPFESANAAQNMVGKTLRSRNPNNTNSLRVDAWEGQNYVVFNGTDYSVTPVMWALQLVSSNRVVVE